MPSPSQLEPRDLGKRRYWGLAGLIGFGAGTIASYSLGSDILMLVGVVAGLIGGFIVAAIRGSNEI